MRVVDVSDNNLHEEAASVLASTLLMTECAITSVDISHNCIGDIGATLLAKALMRSSVRTTRR